MTIQMVSARETRQVFDEGRSSSLVELVFDADGWPIRKLVKLSGLVGLVASDDKAKKAEAGWLLAKALREAERDAAYRKHGNDWTAHVRGFWGPPTEADEKLIADALDMIVRQSNDAEA